MYAHVFCVYVYININVYVVHKLSKDLNLQEKKEFKHMGTRHFETTHGCVKQK